MADLVLHVGYPKTATTWLQERVWPANFAYPGLAAEADDGKRLRAHLNRAYWQLGPSMWGRAEGRWILDHWQRYAGAGTVLWSDEKLLGVSPFLPRRDHPFFHEQEETVVAHARALAQAPGAWWERLRVVVFVREQASYLASSYAQSSNRLVAGQRDFRRRLRALLAAGEEGALTVLAYHRLVARLQAVLGPANVHVFLYEDVVRGGFDTAFQAAFGRTPEGIARPAANTRRAGAGWALRPPRPSPYTRCPAWLGRLRYRLLRRAGQASITLPPELDDALKAYFAAGNARLAALLDRDLGSLGYGLPTSAG